MASRETVEGGGAKTNSVDTALNDTGEKIAGWEPAPA